MERVWSPDLIILAHTIHTTAAQAHHSKSKSDSRFVGEGSSAKQGKADYNKLFPMP